MLTPEKKLYTIWQQILAKLIFGNRRGLSCQAEDSNPFDPYNVAIRKRAEVIGHVPRKISAVCSFLYKKEVLYLLIPAAQYSADLLQGGVLCKLEFQCRGTDLLSIVKKLVKSAPVIEFELKPCAPLPYPNKNLKQS